MILYSSVTEENELYEWMTDEWWLISGKPLDAWLFYNRKTLSKESQQCMNKEMNIYRKVRTLFYKKWHLDEKYVKITVILKL